MPGLLLWIIVTMAKKTYMVEITDARNMQSIENELNVKRLAFVITTSVYRESRVNHVSGEEFLTLLG